MASFGRQTIGVATGNPILVNADGRTDGYKHAGVTIDWATVTAVTGSDVTLADGKVVMVGDKFLRYGTVLDVITASGKYGPVNTAATDGRQVMERGQSYILDHSVVMSSLGSDHPPVLDDGLVFWDRIVKDGTNEPTSANILIAFPDLRLVRETN